MGLVQKRLSPIRGKKRAVKKEIKLPTLYHITAAQNAKLIKRGGFDSTFGFTEGYMAEAKADAILSGEYEGDEGEYDVQFMDDAPEELKAREVFNGYIDDFIHYSEKKRGYPSHSSSVFFWKSEGRAKDHIGKTNPAEKGRYKVVKVDASKVPCQCYEGSWEKAEDLFQVIHLDVNKASVCGSLEALDIENKQFQRYCKKIDAAAKKYVSSLKPMKADESGAVEVMCPCDIPRSAIISIDGVSPYQTTLDDYPKKRRKSH